jgi:hypothetical protein
MYFTRNHCDPSPNDYNLQYCERQNPCIDFITGLQCGAHMITEERLRCTITQIPLLHALKHCGSTT